MPQEYIDSVNIKTFGFTTMLDLANRKMVFDIAELTEFKGNGGANIVGINFSLNDSSNNPLIPGNSGNLVYDWAHPNITDPSTNANPNYSGASSLEVDLVEIFGNNYTAIFQNFRIQGAIKDADGKVYETTALIKGAPMPPGFTDLGYVPGKFSIEADCQNGYLSVHETTNLAYCGKMPLRQSSSGTLYYPRGTVDPIPFAFTSPVAFTNNVVYTGNYKVINTTTAVYDSGLDFFVQVEYYTESEAFDITCEKHMLSIMCCLEDFQQNMLRNCSGAQYEAMHDKWTEAGTLLAIGLAKEDAGKDATAEAQKIRKLLNCNCTSGSLNRISPNPVNQMVYSITVQGKNGTNVTPSTTGSTKTFEVSSNVYQVLKGDPSDLSFTIDTNTSTPGIVKYIITFDYQKLAQKVNQYINTSGLTIGVAISLCSIDYNGNPTTVPYPASTPLPDFLQALASVGCTTSQIFDAILGLTADNGLYATKDANGNPVIRLGTNPLIEDTTISTNGKRFLIRNGQVTYREFTDSTTTLWHRTGLAATDVFTLLYLKSGLIQLEESTNGDRALISYLAKSHFEVQGTRVAFGTYYPNTMDGSIPPPPLDANKSARIITDVGVIDFYAKTYNLAGGGTFNFTDVVPIIPKLTTLARTGLTPIRGMLVFDLDFGAYMWHDGVKWVGIKFFGSTCQVYDGTNWLTVGIVNAWVQSTSLATTLFQPAGSINNQLYNYVIRDNSVTIDYSISVTTTAAGFIVIKTTLPVPCVAGKKFHSWSNIAGSPVDCTINLNVNEPTQLTFSALNSVPAGTYYINGQVTYQSA